LIDGKGVDKYETWIIFCNENYERRLKMKEIKKIGPKLKKYQFPLNQLWVSTTDPSQVKKIKPIPVVLKYLRIYIHTSGRNEFFLNEAEGLLTTEAMLWNKEMHNSPSIYRNFKNNRKFELFWRINFNNEQNIYFVPTKVLKGYDDVFSEDFLIYAFPTNPPCVNTQLPETVVVLGSDRSDYQLLHEILQLYDTWEVNPKRSPFSSFKECWKAFRYFNYYRYGMLDSAYCYLKKLKLIP